MEDWVLNYSLFLQNHSNLDYNTEVGSLIEDLPNEWTYKYRKFKSKFDVPNDIVQMQLNTFSYIYDFEHNIRKTKNGSVLLEPRVIVAFGKTNPQKVRRDDSRLKGWGGQTQEIFGNEWDKGHFIANSMGGRVDHHEINVFQQLRTLNRGWSNEGKLFRKMEKYCSNNKDIFCWHRPFYLDLSDIPNYLEFGILLPDCTVWIEIFNNRNVEE